jgi:hypothetical protein
MPISDGDEVNAIASKECLGGIAVDWIAAIGPTADIKRTGSFGLESRGRRTSVWKRES